MMQEAARAGFDHHLVTMPGYIQSVERLDRIARLTMDRAERGEVVPPDQPLRRAVHGAGIKRLMHKPGAVGIQRQRCAAVGDAIAIGPPDAREAGVPVVSHGGTGDDRDRGGAQPGVDRFG